MYECVEGYSDTSKGKPHAGVALVRIMRAQVKDRTWHRLLLLLGKKFGHISSLGSTINLFDPEADLISGLACAHLILV